METLVKRAIVLAGHKVHGETADQEIREHVAQEHAAGKKHVNHLLYDDGKGRRKHNLLLDGAPMIAYTYFNILFSPLEQAVILCNKESQHILHACEEFSMVHRLPIKDFIFADEQQSFSENIFKGAELLGAMDGKHTFVLAGDTPLRYDYSPSIADKDILNHDLILDMNAKKYVGNWYPRNYHWYLDNEPFKEPNGFVCNLSGLSPTLMERIYASRRTYDAKSSRKNLLKDIFFEHWKQLLPIITEKYFLDNINTLRKASIEGVHMSASQLEKGISLITGMKTKVKMENHDPATLKDMDSLQDWIYFQAMASAAIEPNGKDTYHDAYPHIAVVREFGKEMTPRLSETIEMYRDFPAFMNKFCTTFDLKPIYPGGKFKKDYLSPLIPTYMIRNDVADHKRYFHSLASKHVTRR